MAYDQSYYLRNRDEILRKQREKYASDPEFRAKRQAYRRPDPDAHRRYLVARNADRRQFVWNIKWAKGCADCGARPHPEALHFDHLPGADKVECVSILAQKSWPKLLTEISKCEVVCANCHAERTWNRRQAS